jgi:hypothetical protein
LFVAASVLNPAYFAGCGMGEEEYQFDAADMLALLEKANGSFEAAHAGETYRIDLEVEAEPEPTASASLWGSPKAFACQPPALRDGQRLLRFELDECARAYRRGPTRRERGERRVRRADRVTRDA